MVRHLKIAGVNSARTYQSPGGYDWKPRIHEKFRLEVYGYRLTNQHLLKKRVWLQTSTRPCNHVDYVNETGLNYTVNVTKMVNKTVTTYVNTSNTTETFVMTN